MLKSCQLTMLFYGNICDGTVWWDPPRLQLMRFLRFAVWHDTAAAGPRCLHLKLTQYQIRTASYLWKQRSYQLWEASGELGQVEEGLSNETNLWRKWNCLRTSYLLRFYLCLLLGGRGRGSPSAQQQLPSQSPTLSPTSPLHFPSFLLKSL